MGCYYDAGAVSTLSPAVDRVAMPGWGPLSKCLFAEGGDDQPCCRLQGRRTHRELVKTRADLGLGSGILVAAWGTEGEFDKGSRSIPVLDKNN